VKPIPHRHHAAGKRKIRRRLDRPVTAPSPDPVFTASNIHYDVATKTRAIPCGGIGAIQLLVRKLGLAEAIDERLHVLKFHFPYHESDHVLNFAYNALCNGSVSGRRWCPRTIARQAISHCNTGRYKVGRPRGELCRSQGLAANMQFSWDTTR